MVRISPHLDWIRRDTQYLSIFSPNAGKYGPELRISPYLDTFHAAARCEMFRISEKMYLLLCKPLTVSTNLKNFQFMKKDQNTENSDSFETKNKDVDNFAKSKYDDE